MLLSLKLFKSKLELVSDEECLWNSLPGELRRKSDLEEFKRHLKGNLFSKADL